MASTAAAPRAAGRIGRFELQRIIGRGTQATVWLARDPRLERPVALKLMAPQAAEAGLGDWLTEARHVAGLNHPHVVPVYEADVHDAGSGPQPYLVFEYVSGAPLDRHLRERGPFAPREAVEWLLGVLDALAQAHAAGLVHRDLKPSNLLVDAAGRARVTDFGIAVKSGAAAAAAGTPRYVAPETLRGEAPTPAVDVFALGLLLAELMLGRPLVDESAVPEVLARIAHADLALPAQMPQPVDDGLRGVIQRALARDPGARYADAGELRRALLAWLTPDAEAAPATDASGAKAGALDFLLRRMRHKSDFPALSDSVARIQRVAASEHENLGTLAGEILKDVALTHKLLRLVNTAHYSHAGGGSISTVSRAVALMGFAGVRNLALSLVLVEHMNDKLHAQQIKQEFLRALLAGTLAEELCGGGLRSHGAVEEAFLGAMFRNLGRLLTEFYFPEEAEQVRRLVQPGVPAARENPRLPVPESNASRSVLGLSYEELGLGVARHWGLPETLQRCMRLTGTASPPAQPPAALPERLRWIASVANEAADTLLQHEPEEAARRLGELGERYSRVLGVPAREVVAAVGRSRTRLAELAAGLEIVLKPGTPAERLLVPRPAALAGAAPAARTPGAGDTLSDLALGDAGLEATMALAEPRGRDRPAAADPAAVLAAGIQDITNSMVEEVRLGEVLRMILETMYRALGFRRVLFCLRDPRSGALAGRFLLGEGGDALRDAFRVATRVVPGQGPDLFTAVCLKGADTLIADASAAAMRARLPGWFLQAVDAPAFLLLPLMVKNAPVGLIYADKAEPGAIALSEKELSLLRTLRNQAVMAFRQASGG
jgi:serine/threonine protein kinase